MSKVPKSKKFLDLSDYGRTPGRLIALSLQYTFITPVIITFLFFLVGLVAAYCIVNQNYLLAAILIVLKSILDASDGELARLRNMPSYIGRFTDSIADIILNLILFITIAISSDSSIKLSMVAFFCFQLQGTLYNYYYVIYRRNVSGDETSRVFEKDVPEALGDESQKMVGILYKLYRILYGVFDQIIYKLDFNASKSHIFPKNFMTATSMFGLGFQLLIMAVLMALGYIEIIIPFFLVITVFIPVLIFVRKFLIKSTIPE
jgi:phosphatidylglycerophosphate synthase